MYDELVTRLRWHTALVLLMVWLLAACGGRTRRDAGSDSADAGSASAMDTCGDGIVTEPEECDGADPLGVTCADLGFDVGEVRCSNDCTYDGATCAYTFSQVSAGGRHTCGVRTDGTVTCWGDDEFGQATPPGGTFSQISTGDSHACAVSTDGSVACWGFDRYGQATPPRGTYSQVGSC